jgi:2-iminobutanoate/2-iminopropanoate deaminase
MTPAMDAHRINIEPDWHDQFKISLGYRVGNLVIVSGQAAIDDAGRIVGPDDFDSQAEQVFANLKRVLEAAGSSLGQVVKVTIYLTDMSNFHKIVDLRGRYFTRPWPADTIVGVTALALPELKIEIEATALVDGKLIEGTTGLSASRPRSNVGLD